MWIVCKDDLFATALKIALRQRGIDASIRADLPPRKSDPVCDIIDLDSIPADTGISPLSVTFSRFPEKGADFTRPFLFWEFCDLVIHRLAPVTLPVAAVPQSQGPCLQLLPNGVLLFGKHIALSPAEHALLTLLVNAHGQCVPTEKIDTLWQGSGGNTTAVYISYLRKKLASATDLHLIRSVRGRGYCLCLPR